MMTDLEIDHIQIAMPDGGEPEARDYFTGLLGLAEIPKPADMLKRGRCWFAVGDRQIHLGVDKDFRPAKKAHVALKSMHLNTLRAKLELAGYETIDDMVIDGRHRFFSYDPFGNRIEFIDKAPQQ